MPEQTKKMTIDEAIPWIMSKVTKVPKSGRNEFHKYNYATEEDLVEEVRGFMAQAGIYVMPVLLMDPPPSYREIKSEKGDSLLFSCAIEWRFYDSAGGCRSAVLPCAGMDKGDKGPYKAITGSEKYALKTVFLIPTGDDTADGDPQQKNKPPKPNPQQKPGKPPEPTPQQKFETAVLSYRKIVGNKEFFELLGTMGYTTLSEVTDKAKQTQFYNQLKVLEKAKKDAK